MGEKCLWAGQRREQADVNRCRSKFEIRISKSKMSLLRFCEWLAATPGSIALHESHYLYLIVLSVHVLTLCLFVGTTAMVDLRLLGLTMPGVRASEVVKSLLPWSAAGFLIMVISGALLFYAAPVLRYQNIFFRAKMAVLVLAGVNAWVFGSCPTTKSQAGGWSGSGVVGSPDHAGTPDSVSGVLVRLKQESDVLAGFL
jgi:hypothetical protein